jgi:hypothetical protein
MSNRPHFVLGSAPLKETLFELHLLDRRQEQLALEYISECHLFLDS